MKKSGDNSNQNKQIYLWLRGQQKEDWSGLAKAVRMKRAWRAALSSNFRSFIVLVLACYLTNQDKSSNFKQQPFMSSQFCRSESDALS